MGVRVRIGRPVWVWPHRLGLCLWCWWGTARLAGRGWQTVGRGVRSRAYGGWALPLAKGQGHAED